MSKLIFFAQLLKFRKQQKGRTNKTTENSDCLHFGRFAIRAQANSRLPLHVVEAVRRVITRKLKRTGKVWVCVHPNLSVSKKPLEMRMGKGKGATSYWACRLAKGTILYEIDGVDKSRALQASRVASKKLGIRTLFVSL